jgi:hypothetical protein
MLIFSFLIGTKRLASPTQAGYLKVGKSLPSRFIGLQVCVRPANPILDGHGLISAKEVGHVHKQSAKFEQGTVLA